MFHKKTSQAIFVSIFHTIMLLCIVLYLWNWNKCIFYILVIYLKFYVRVVDDQRKHFNRKTFQKISNFLIVSSGWSKCFNQKLGSFINKFYVLKETVSQGFYPKNYTNFRIWLWYRGDIWIESTIFWHRRVKNIALDNQIFKIWFV